MLLRFQVAGYAAIDNWDLNPGELVSRAEAQSRLAATGT